MGNGNIKVAFLQHGIGYGGATKSLALMQKSISDLCEIYTYTLPFKPDKKEILAELKYTHRIQPINLPIIGSYSGQITSRKKFYKRKTYFPTELIKEINENKYEIFHINSTLFPHLIKPIKDNTDARVVVHLRESMKYGFMNEVESYIIHNIENYADHIIAISENEHKFYTKSPKISVLPNPHDFSESDKYLAANRNNEIVIGMAANFNREKGHIDFLNMAKLVSAEITNQVDLRFRIVGYPKNSFKLKDVVKQILNYGYKSKFRKALRKVKINNLDINEYSYNINNHIQDIDIFVRPDLSGQPWGRDVIEALALKKAVVATGTSEFYIKNNYTGILVEPGNPRMLAKAVINIINDKNMRISLGEAGYNHVKNLCDINNYGERIKIIYRDLLK